MEASTAAAFDFLSVFVDFGKLDLLDAATSIGQTLYLLQKKSNYNNNLPEKGSKVLKFKFYQLHYFGIHEIRITLAYDVTFPRTPSNGSLLSFNFFRQV